MKITTALFDLDGTLVDSLEDLTDAVNHIRHAFAYPQLSTAHVRQIIGKGSRNLIQQALPGASDRDHDHALDMFLDFNREHIADKSRLYPGMQETLDEIARRDILMAVISNKNEDLSLLILRTLGIQDLFALICGGDTYPEKKPHPLPLLNVIEALGTTPAACVMIGDSINDIEAGNRAGVASIACSWGYGSSKDLAGATVQVHTPQELLAVITADLQ